MIRILNLSKSYRLGSQFHRVVNNVSLHIQKGETLGLVGGSGCGKSSLGKMLMRLVDPSAGSIYFEGTDLTTLSRKELQPWRRKMQMIFQDPYSSLNPAMTVQQTLEEPIHIHQIASSAETMLNNVGLSGDYLKRYPHELSGGQRQRVAIARALTVQPEILICDEPLAALDMVTQHQIMELFKKIRAAHGMTLLFISHDLLAVRALADRIAVMQAGEIIEEGPTDYIFSCCRHPYTQRLLDAIL